MRPASALGLGRPRRPLGVGLSLACALAVHAAQTTPARADEPPSPGDREPAAPAQPGPEAPSGGEAGDDDPALTRPARPPPFEPLRVKGPPWPDRFWVGLGLGISERLSSADAAGAPSHVRYGNTFGARTELGLVIAPWLGASLFHVLAYPSLELPRGALVSGAERDPSDTSSVFTFTFGARFHPTLPLSERVSLGAIVGFSWSRVEVPALSMRDVGATTSFRVPKRALSYYQIPLGLRGSVYLVPRRLSVELEVALGVPFLFDGDGRSPSQAVDASGRTRDVARLPDPSLEVSQTLGLAFHL